MVVIDHRFLLGQSVHARRSDGEWHEAVIIDANIQNPDALCREGVANAVSNTIQLAEAYYDSGLAGLTYLPLQNNIAIGIAAFVYRAIGKRLNRKGGAWWLGREIVLQVAKAE